MTSAADRRNGQHDPEILEVPRTPEDQHAPSTTANGSDTYHLERFYSEEEAPHHEQPPPNHESVVPGAAARQRRLSIQLPPPTERVVREGGDQIPIDYLNPEGMLTLRRSLSNVTRTGASSTTADQYGSLDSQATLNDFMTQPLDFETFLRLYLKK